MRGTALAFFIGGTKGDGVAIPIGRVSNQRSLGFRARDDEQLIQFACVCNLSPIAAVKSAKTCPAVRLKVNLMPELNIAATGTATMFVQSVEDNAENGWRGWLSKPIGRLVSWRCAREFPRLCDRNESTVPGRADGNER